MSSRYWRDDEGAVWVLVSEHTSPRPVVIREATPDEIAALDLPPTVEQATGNNAIPVEEPGVKSTIPKYATVDSDRAEVVAGHLTDELA